MTTTAIDQTFRYGFALEYVPKMKGSDHGRLALAVDSSVMEKNENE